MARTRTTSPTRSFKCQPVGHFLGTRRVREELRVHQHTWEKPKVACRLLSPSTTIFSDGSCASVVGTRSGAKATPSCIRSRQPWPFSDAVSLCRLACSISLEDISLVYPQELAGCALIPRADSLSDSRVQFSVRQMKNLAPLCVLLETFIASGVFRPLSVHNGSTAKTDESRQDPNLVFVFDNPEVLLLAIKKASDAELVLLLDSLATRIENVMASVTLRRANSAAASVFPAFSAFMAIRTRCCSHILFSQLTHTHSHLILSLIVTLLLFILYIYNLLTLPKCPGRRSLSTYLIACS